MLCDNSQSHPHLPSTPNLKHAAAALVPSEHPAASGPGDPFLEKTPKLYRCSSCQIEFGSRNGLFNHHKNAELNIDSSSCFSDHKKFCCEVDGVPSNCGLQYQFTKSTGFKCQAVTCPVVLPSESALEEHYRSNHLTIIFRCKICPNVGFETFEWFLKHFNEEHVNVLNKTREGIEISRQVQEFVEKLHNCQVCSKPFHSTLDYQRHMTSCPKDHFVFGIHFVCDICAATFSSARKLYLHNREIHIVSNSSVSILNDIQPNPDLLENITTPASSRKSDKSQNQRERKFVENPARKVKKRLLRNSFMIPKNVSTIGGKEFVRTSRLRNRNINLPENVSLDKLTLSTRVSARGTSKTSTELKNSTPSTNSQNHPLRFPSCSTLELTNSKYLQDLESVEKKSEARLEDGTFKCLKCPDLIPMSSESLLFEHVKCKHAQMFPENDWEYFWCPECGDEFVTKPTFIKHLICAHVFIKNHEEYFTKIGYGMQDLKNQRPLQENQCEVCYCQCKDQSDYQSHLRFHGMAFLRQRSKSKSN